MYTYLLSWSPFSQPLAPIASFEWDSYVQIHIHIEIHIYSQSRYSPFFSPRRQ